jgi:hypothetical protein
MNSTQVAYQKACDIADLLLSRGYPVLGYESIDGEIIIRFGGPNPQEIHARAGEASFEGFVEAIRGYDRKPDWRAP